MATAERMAESIRIEGQGVFGLLWDAKEDLIRALLVLNAALHDVQTKSLLLAPGSDTERALRELIETRVSEAISTEDEEESGQPPARELWLLFLQQASSEVVGPWLNGWRGTLIQSPGAVLVVRHADFKAIQRSAPDLASFIGPRIHNASTMLSVVSRQTFERLKLTLASSVDEILSQLPGTAPGEAELRDWVDACSPIDGE